MDDFIVSTEEAAAILGINPKALRQRLRDERPIGARQFPPQPGGNWFLRPSYVEQLATQRGRRIPKPSIPSHDRPISTHGPTVEELGPQPAPARGVADSSHGTWSEWIPFSEALKVAPRFPGVYMVRIAELPNRGPVYILGWPENVKATASVAA